MNHHTPHPSHIVDMENHGIVSDWDTFLTWLQSVQMPEDDNLPAVPQFVSSDLPQLQLIQLDVQTPSPPPYGPWQHTFPVQDYVYMDHMDSESDTWSQTFSVPEDTGPSQFETSSPPESPLSEHNAPEDTEPQVCPMCKVEFYRRQERNRHMRSFLPHSIYCPFEQCSWRGDRHDNLKKHWLAKHAHVQFPDQQQWQIYDSDALVELVVRKDYSIEFAADVALLLVEQRAHVLNKIGIWTNGWGRKPKSFDH